jgi:tetratricopeptide (TPR) repeat protein
LAHQWHWKNKLTSNNLEDIFRPKDSLCFLVGAGISVDIPCCFPTGYEFTLYALQSLIPEEERANILALTDPNREKARGPGDFLRFEQLMQYMQGWFDPDLHILDCYATPSTPNLNHLFLAHMIKLRHLVFTTNFDSMIEQALLETRTPKDRIIPIIYKKDWVLPTNKKDCCVYKLHGSLVDFRNGSSCRDTLQATLEQIARMKEGNVFTLEAWKERVLQESFQTHNLVVLGYSGLDDFDVLPTLWSIPSTRKLIWISHDSSLDVQNAVISVIGAAASNPSADSDKPLNRMEGNLLSFVEKMTRRPIDIIWIKVNTRKLVEWLWRRYIRRPLPADNSYTFPSAGKPFMFDFGLSKLEKWTLTGMIFHDRHMDAQSLNAFRTALSHSQGQWQQEWTDRDAINHYIVESEQLKTQSACVNNIGVILQSENRLDEAGAFFQRACNLAERMDDTQGRSYALTNLGAILEKQGKLQEAREHYQQAIILAESIHDLKARAHNLLHIGGLHQMQKEPDALQFYMEVLKINEQLGDLPEKAKTLNRMGILHFKDSRYDEARDLYQQALEISESLGDLGRTATILFNIARLAEEQDQVDKALAYYQRAADIYASLGDIEGTTDSLDAINSLLDEQERNEESTKYH